jgi:hypothetical protein
MISRWSGRCGLRFATVSAIACRVMYLYEFGWCGLCKALGVHGDEISLGISSSVLFCILNSVSVPAVSQLDVRLLVQICGNFQRASSFVISLLAGYTPSIRTLDKCNVCFAFVSLLCGVSYLTHWTELPYPTANPIHHLKDFMLRPRSRHPSPRSSVRELSSPVRLLMTPSPSFNSASKSYLRRYKSTL